MAKSNNVSMARLHLLAYEYLAEPSEEKRARLERLMSEYATANPAANLKQLMQLRLYLYHKSKNLEEALQF